jgi:hypothetical protein
MSGRAGQIVAAAMTAAVLAGTSQAAAPDRVTEPTWKRALWIRSDALNQRYGLGEYSQKAAPTAEPSWRRALRIRGEAMNRTHRAGGVSPQELGRDADDAHRLGAVRTSDRSGAAAAQRAEDGHGRARHVALGVERDASE